MAEQQTRILWIGHDPRQLEQWRHRLEQEFELHCAGSAGQALALIRDQGSYEAVIGTRADESDEGLGLFDRVRELSPASVRLLVTAESEREAAGRAVEQGRVYRYLLSPGSAEELVSALHTAVMENTRTLHRLQLEQETRSFIDAGDRLRSAAMFDPELGIGSPEAMEIEFEYTHNIAGRYHRPYAVALVDLDDIEGYAIHYGRKAAKLAHKLMAEHIRHSCRAADRIYRCGGGTPVLLILPETGIEGALVLAERIVRSFAARGIPNSKSEHGLLTLSASVTACEPDGRALPAWRDLLDESELYVRVAQGRGGNAVARREDVEEETA